MALRLAIPNRCLSWSCKEGGTAQFLFKRSRKPRFVGFLRENLNVFYALVAAGEANIDRQRKTGQPFFNVSS